MDSSAGNYEILIAKIDEFIRKYYLNKIIRGSLYLAAILFASYVAVTVAEYYGNFNPIGRTLLFYAFILLNLAILIRWIVLPFLAYLRLGKTIGHEQASEIIGDHFGDVKDKLLNTLQLKKLADSNKEQFALIHASINQKITELRPVPFAAAVIISENKKYVKYALAPLLLILLVSFIAPSIFSDSTERLIQHNKRFVKKAPFQFVLLNKSLKATQGDDYELQVKLTGDQIPKDLYLEDGPNSFKLDKESIIRFNYTFKNIQQDKKIRLTGGEFSSETYTIEVKRKPVLLNFDVYLEYPAYLDKQNETLANSGDLTVPQGTKINWKFHAKNANDMIVGINSRQINVKPSSTDLFNFSLRAMSNTSYFVRPVNNEVINRDSVAYQVQVIPDLSPAIEVTERADSANRKLIYFVGQVSDDHGFSKLDFHYAVRGADKQIAQTKTVTFDKNSLQSNFFYVWSLEEARILPGQQLEYYFEVYDNDGVNGAKSTKSPVKTLNMPTEREMESKISESSESIKKKMENAIAKASQIEAEAKKLNQDLISKKNLSYEEKKQVEDLLKKQKTLEDLVKEIQKENSQNSSDKQDLKEMSAEMVEKQKQLDNLINNVFDEKIKELLKNIEKLLENNNKPQTQQQLSRMQLDNKNLKKELERINELYKQLEFDQKLTQTIDELKKQAEEQKKLAEDSRKLNEDPKGQKTDADKKAANPDKQDAAELKKDQDKLNEDFKKLQEDLKSLEEKKEDLSDPNNFENPKKEQEDIKQQQEQSSKNLDNKNMKKASEAQQKAAQQMQQMAEKMEQQQQENEEQQNGEDAQALRTILKNLLTSSFDQEKVMQSLKQTSVNDPNYNTLTQKQKDIKDNLAMVEDSLYALSKRVPQIQSVVNKEIQAINQNIDLALESLPLRRNIDATRNQQYAMTSINNLALMLSEALNNMQMSMKSSKSGKGKKGRPSLSQLSKMQQKLNENMQKAREQMKQGGQQGQKPGQQQGQQGQQGQGQGQNGMSEQLARMAREQQMIRQAMQDLNRELNKDGQGSLGDLDKLAKDMEKTETDLVNKRIEQETLMRQQEIITKLLDAEKAERERETDPKRESKEGKEQTANYKIVLEEYKKIKQRETELLKTLPPALNSFYKTKIGDYFKLLNPGN